MTLETQAYLYIILSGFITVWTFRYLINSQKPLNDFEYLGLSVFWGLVNFFLSILYLKWSGIGAERIAVMFSDPLRTGFNLSIFFGPFLGFLGWAVAKPLKFIIDKYKQVVKIK